jgi:hypothetical protein
LASASLASLQQDSISMSVFHDSFYNLPP